MVRETKTLGEGRSADTQPEQLPTVRNVAVYDSTRMVNDWELVFISEKVTNLNDCHKLFHRMQALLGHDFVRNIDSKYNGSQDRCTAYFQILLAWKKKQKHGLLEIGNVAKMLKEIGFKPIAEMLEP